MPYGHNRRRHHHRISASGYDDIDPQRTQHGQATEPFGRDVERERGRESVCSCACKRISLRARAPFAVVERRGCDKDYR